MSVHSAARPWWKLQLSTWLFGLLVAVGLFLVEVPGQSTVQIGVPDSVRDFFSQYEHGWPLTYLIRSMPDASDKTYDLPNSCWNLTHHVQALRYGVLAADIFAAATILFAAVVLFAAWRRRRKSLWQFRLIDLLGGLTAFGAACGWYSYENGVYHREQQAIGEIQANNAKFKLYSEEVVYQHGGPSFLHELLGGEAFSFLNRVVVAEDIDHQPRLAGSFARLKSLSPKRKSFGPAEVDAILQLRELEALHLIFVELEPSAKTPERTCLADLQPLPRLRSFMSTSDSPIADYHWLAGCLSLEELVLSNEIVDGDLEAWKGLKHIRSVSLVGSLKFTEKGMQEICNWSELEHVSLHARHTAQGIRHLEKLDKLRELYLRGFDPLDGAGIEELKRFRGLKLLMLDEAVVTDAQLAEIKRALPAVNVIRPYATF